MSWEFARHVEPDRTMIIEMGELARGFPIHDERYPGAMRMPFDGHVVGDETAVRDWLKGLDVLYSAETFYDWRIIEWAAEAGCATVLHVMPEFYRHGLDPSLPKPDRFWTPTSWRLEDLDPATIVVPVPVALDRFEPKHRTEAVTFLHIAGHRAAADRAGTTTILRALRRVSSRVRIIMITQDENLPQTSLRRNVTLERRVRSKCEYWELYDGDVLLSPRRYGGLSLVHNEAAAAGMALLLSNVSPNPTTWPGRYVNTTSAGEIRTPSGVLPVSGVDPEALAVEIDELAQNPSIVADLSAASICWAQDHSWKTLAGEYLTQLDAARC
jgi:glycosyltransferase involved in cell wall biosynthesis